MIIFHYNARNFIIKTMKDFNLNLKPKRPMWQDIALFCVVTISVWSFSHVFMNYSAFAEIAQYKAKVLRASVLENFGEVEHEGVRRVSVKREETSDLRKIEKKKQLFKKRKLEPRTQKKDVFSGMEVFPSDNRIYIPKIEKNVPLVDVPSHRNWYQLEQNIQSGLRDGVVVHPTSHAPGAVGNFFATGHSSYYVWDSGRFKDVFALLHEVKIGDTVEVYWNGQKFEYTIKEEKIVPPTDISVLNHPTDRSILTLMTCTPVGTNKNRLILVGELKNL